MLPPARVYFKIEHKKREALRMGHATRVNDHKLFKKIK